MKKFFLALCAIIMGMAANAADYYLIGGFNDWTLKGEGCQFTAAEDGTYVLDYEGTLTSGFKINDGTWDQGAPNFGSNGSALKLGEPYVMTVGSDSKDIAIESTVANPHLVLNVSDPSKPVLTITSTEAPVESVITYAIHGQIFGVPSWSTTEMTEAEDGTWTLTADIVAGEFGIKKLDNGTQIAWFAADGAAAVSVNTAMHAKVDGTNWTSTLEGKYTFVFDPAAMTLTIKGEETPVDPDPVDPDPVDPVYTYAIHGSVFTGSWESRGMDKGENGTWILTATLQAGEFGIRKLDAEGNQAAWISAQSGYAEAVVGIAMTAATVNNTNWVSNLVGEYTFVFDPTAMTLTIVGEETPVDPDPVDPVDPVYTYAIHGQIFGNPSWSSTAMTAAEDGTWTLTANIVAGEFGIKKLDAEGNQAGWIAAQSGYPEAVVGIAMTAATVNNTNWVSTLEGEYTFVFDPTAMTLTIVGVETPVDPDPVDPDPVDPVLPAHVYIVGNLADGNWATATAPELTFAEDTKLFSIENIEIKPSSDESTTGYFSFITVQGSDWDTEVNNGDRYGAPEKDALLTVPSTTNVTLFKAGVNASAANSWKVEAGYYDIVLDLANMTINIIESDSSAADIELGNEVAPVYFNLQGVQVAEPAAGLYIEVRGNQVRKVMIK